MFLDNLLARAKIIGKNERVFRENMTEAGERWAKVARCFFAGR